MTELVEWAQDRPIFNLNEAERALGIERESLKVKLHRMVERGELKRIERGLYTIHEDHLIYATHIETPSYLSLWSGLRFYDLTTQLSTQAHIMTGINRKDLEKTSFHYSKYIFGFGKKQYRGFDIFVAEKEKLLIDCLSRREVPVSELIELVEETDLVKAAEYAERIGQKAVKKRLGYLFQNVRGETVKDLKTDDRNYTPLDLSHPDDGDKNSEWMVKVNTDAF